MSPWVQVSPMAKMSPAASFTTAIGTPSTTKRAASLVPRSSTAQTRTDATSAPLQLGLERGGEPLLELGRADLLDDLGEEAAHHEPARLVFADAASHQVEQLLVVEA